VVTYALQDEDPKSQESRPASGEEQDRDGDDAGALERSSAADYQHFSLSTQ